MKIIITKDYEELSARAAKIMLEVVKGNPYAVLGLATGTTPLGLYAHMIADHEKHGTSYAHIRTVNLDEYKGLPKTHPQSYAYFMRKNLFDGLNIDPENTNILGSNGHIAFNEPHTPFGSGTHVVELAESTVKDNARLFDDISEVPRKAFTMGIKQIMQAKKILILASGTNKADAVCRMAKGEVTESVPASVLQLHPDCILIADSEAAAKL